MQQKNRRSDITKKLIPIILAAVMLSSCTAKENGTKETSKIKTTTEAMTTTTAERDSYNYVEVSVGNEFIDFDYIEDYKGTTNIGDLAEKAVQAVKESDYYTNSMENKDKFTDEEFAEYFDGSGNITPIFSEAFPNDYDCDGKTETFILVNMPDLWNDCPDLRSILLFADSNYNIEILDDMSGLFPICMINYGNNKQLIIGGSGVCGADDHKVIYGMRNGEAVELYGIRGDFYKTNCFVSVFGWQASGDFMYFDTVALEYRVISGEKLDIDEVLSMDKTNSLDDLDLDLSSEWCGVYYISKKYYCFSRGMMDSGVVYTYENGKFTLTENSGIRISENFFGMNAVKNIDIDKAVAEMKKLEK